MIEYIAAGVGFLIASRMVKKNMPKIKGYLGEGKLTRKVKKLPIPGKVVVMRDSLFKSDWGSSQIDVLAVTRYGLMVFEMKNRAGDIHGAVGTDPWYVKLEGQVYSLPSPIRQNNSHVAALHKILSDEFPHMHYLPLTVFSDKANLYIQNSRNKVCHLKDVHKVIKRQLGNEILSDKDIEQVTSILEKNLLTTRKDRINHVTAIELSKEMHEEYTPKELNQLKQEIMYMAKDKPILSASGEQHMSANPYTGPDMHRPLRELLQEAEERAMSNDTDSSHLQER